MVAEWAGTPFLLRDRQVAIVGDLFSWVNATGLCRYRRFLLLTARKSCKTELAAAIANLLLFSDGEQSIKIVYAAGNAEQAERAVVFEFAHYRMFVPVRAALIAERGVFDQQDWAANAEVRGALPAGFVRGRVAPGEGRVGQRLPVH